MTELGTAYINVLPSMSGFTPAVEKGFDSKGAGKSAGSKFSSTFTSTAKKGSMVLAGAIGGVVSSVTTKAMGEISSSVGSAVSRVDTLNNFPKIMANMGISAEASEKAIKAIDKGINGLPTTLDSAVAGVQRFTSKTNDVDKATDYYLALNDAIVAGAAPMAIQETAMEQLSQSFAKGKMDMMEWRSVQAAMPAQLKQIADSMGLTVDALGEGLRSGSVSMESFMDKIVQLDKEGANGFASFADQAKNSIGGLGTQASLTGTAITRNVANVINACSSQIAAGFTAARTLINGFGGTTVEVVSGIMSAIDFEGFQAAANGIAEAFMSAFPEDGGTAKTFGQGVGGMINVLIPLLNALQGPAWLAGQAIQFLGSHPEVTTVLFGVAMGIKMIGGFSAAGTLLKSIGSSIAKIATRALPAAIGTTALATAERKQGAAAAGSAKQTMAMGVAVMMIGGGVALAGAGLLLMANAAVTLAGAGAGAVAIMAGMALGLVGLGAALVIAGPALTAAAPGAIAFGAAVMMIGIGIGVAAAGLTLLCTQLPMIAAYGTTAGAAAMTLGAGLLVMGAGALVAGAGCLVLGAGLLVCAPGLLLCSGAAMILGAAMMMIGTGATMAGTGCMMMGASLPLIAASAAPAAAGISALAGACLLAVPGLSAGSGPASALATAIVPMGSAAMAAAMGLMMIVASLPQIASYAPTSADGLARLADASLQAAPSFQEAAPHMSAMADSTRTMASATLVGAAAMASLVSFTCMAGSAMATVTATAVTMGEGVTSGTSVGSAAMASFASMTTAACTQAAQKVSSAVSSINSQLSRLQSRTIRINVDQGSVKLPHFTMSGAFNAQTGSVPKVDVSWYAKGTVFTRPTIFGGIGEDVPEAAMPLRGRNMMPFAEATADNLGGMLTGGVTNNIYITLDYSAGADANQIVRDIASEIEMYNLMGGR